MEETCIFLDKVNVTLGKTRALQGIDWALGHDQNWAVLGQNGAGKSTFLRLVRGEIWPDQRDGGMRLYAMDAPPTMSPIGVRDKFGIMSAELQDRYISKSWSVNGLEAVLTGFYDTPFLYTQPEKDKVRAAEAIMAELGIQDLAEKLILEMSRGEAAKVLMARALVSGPSVLVLDECLAGMDGPSRRSVIEFLDRVAATGVQLMFAVHRLDEIPGAVTHVLWLENGKVRASGPREAVLPLVREDWHGDAPTPVKAEDFFAPAGGSGGLDWGGEAFLVKLDQAGVVMDGKTLLHPVDLTIQRGERWVVLGENGAGKSTLLQLIHGELPAYFPGKVGWFGRFGTFDMRDVRSRMGFVSPAQQAGYGAMVTGLEVVVSGFFASKGVHEHEIVPAGLRKDAMDLMEKLGIGDLAYKTTDIMSYGKFRRCLLARAVVGDPELLLLDEPLSGLDAESRAKFSTLLESLALSGVTMVHVTHYFEEVKRLATHVIHLDTGAVRYQGPVEGYRNQGGKPMKKQRLQRAK